jgi:tetratricopeptide (TPR) repeat protein
MAKYTEIQTLMTKDTAIDPDEPALWIHLAHAELGLKDFPDAESHYKKALDLATKAESPLPQLIGTVDAGLGEVYARTLLVDDANAAFAAAVKADPTHAAAYLDNEAIIFFQEKNISAQIDAADQAIKVDPDQAVLYFIKAQGLVKNAVFNEATQKFALPPGCLEAYRKYLELAPTGAYAALVTDTLSKAEQPVSPPATSPATSPTTPPAAPPAAAPRN